MHIIFNYIHVCVRIHTDIVALFYLFGAFDEVIRSSVELTPTIFDAVLRTIKS